MFKRILAALAVTLAMLGISGVATAQAAKAAQIQFTLDAPDFTSAFDVAALWSANNLPVEVVLGACSGEHCIHARYGDMSTCAAEGVPTSAVGCTFRRADGSYQVEIGDFVRDVYPYPDRAVQFNALGHEVGHGIIHPLGGGYWHSPEPRDIMYASLSTNDRKKQVTKSTRDYIASLLNQQKGKN